MNIKTHLINLCKQNNVIFKDCQNGHFKLTGKLKVNYYPFSKNKTAYVDGTKKAIKNVSPEQAIKMTYTQPKSQGKSEKRRRNYKNIRKKLHSKGISNCCWCNKPITLDSSTLEHIIPLGSNGIDNENNMTLACKTCNELRGNVMLELGDK